MNKLARSVAVLSLCAGCGSAESDSGSGPGAGGNGGGEPPYAIESDLPEDVAEAGLGASQIKEPMAGACLASAPLEAVGLELPDTQGMASVGRAREALQRDPAEIPWPSRIRTSDFLNYYRFSVAKPADAQGEAFVTAQAKYRFLYNAANPSGVFTGQYDVAITLQALPPKDRAKHAFIPLVDTTPSMTG